MRFSYLSHLQCPREGRSYDAGLPQNLCECGSPLLARYDLKALAKEVTATRSAPARLRCGATTRCFRSARPRRLSAAARV
jgi:hypothetical protein